ncbi:MAG: Rieske (2Fe-2S) protein [Deltaproteobacteria bacterium]|nr:Rieske (2Fe-2S) protein [Deltaproteobacteria bacterium]
MSCPTRRELLKLLGAGAVVACTGCGGPPQPSGDFAAGNVSALSVGELKLVPSGSLIVGRDANGVYAMTAICTHAQCDMTMNGSVSAQGVFCTCHGSLFDANGNVKQGPARSPLQHFAVSVDASGNITVHGGQSVDASTRVSV